MDLIIKLSIVLLSVFIVYRFRTQTASLSVGSWLNVNAMNSVLESNIKEIKKRDKSIASIKYWFNLFNKLPLFDLTPSLKSELEYYARRLHISKNGFERDYTFFYNVKCLFGYSTILIISIFSLFDIGIVFLLPVSYIAFNLPDVKFRAQITEKNVEINKEINRLYSKFYYRIKHGKHTTIRLDEIASKFMNSTNEETKKLCENFIADHAVSERHALHNLKFHYRIPKIQKMSILIGNSLDGVADSTQALDLFKNELDYESTKYVRKQVEKRKKAFDNIIYCCYFFIAEIFIIYALQVLN